MFQSRIARFRAAYEVRNKIKVLQGPDGEEEQLMGLPAEVVFAVQQYRSKVGGTQQQTHKQRGCAGGRRGDGGLTC